MVKKFVKQQVETPPIEPNDERGYIHLHEIVKSYKTGAGDVTVLNNINLVIEQGEFVGVIGKSGSGKSTLINMLTGIDRPSSGQVFVGGVPVHSLTENQMAVWRGKNLGIVFQFFQLLPMLSLVENIMLPMDFCNAYPIPERKARAMHLLEMVDMQDHANKLPTAISGGQQQRVAIARALANDPPIIVADEPTGNLDSKTAEAVFEMFRKLVEAGKTLIMVTHDSSLANRVKRTVLISDGEVVNEFVARALPTLTQQQMLEATRQLKPLRFAPGKAIIEEGARQDKFYIVTKGRVDVLLRRPQANDIAVAQFEPGQYFGEIELLSGGTRQAAATIRASAQSPAEVVVLDRSKFFKLIEESEATRSAVEQLAKERLAENIQARESK